MRLFVVIVSVLVTISAVGCFTPPDVRPSLRSAQLPLFDHERLDFDAEVIERLNDQQRERAEIAHNSPSAATNGVAENTLSHIATEPAGQRAHQLPAKTFEQKQLEQTERIIELMEKTDDEEVRRILAEKILPTNARGVAGAGRAGQGVQFAAYTENPFNHEQDLSRLNEVHTGSFAPAANGPNDGIDSDLRSASKHVEVHAASLNDRADEAADIGLMLATAAKAAADAADSTAEIERKESDTGEAFRPGSWKQELHSAISALEESLYQCDLENDDQATLQIYLRLLHLIANNQEQATRTIPELQDERDQRFWQNQMAALATLLDGRPANADSATFQNSRRAISDRTLDHLRQAIAQLAQDANLQIEHVALCREVNGYGQFESFKTNGFLPEQQVLIYCELENFVSVPIAGGKQTNFETELKGSFTILNEQLQTVYQHEYSAVRDIGQRRRRDFYMYFPMTIPQLPSGSYALQLEVEDLKGNKASTLEKPLPFVIR